MNTIQDTVGRLAIARENITMAQKAVAQILHTFYERKDFAPTDITVRENLGSAIERLELAIHDLKIVRERIAENG